MGCTQGLYPGLGCSSFASLTSATWWTSPSLRYLCSFGQLHRSQKSHSTCCLSFPSELLRHSNASNHYNRLALSCSQFLGILASSASNAKYAKSLQMFYLSVNLPKFINPSSLLPFNLNTHPQDCILVRES